MAVVLSTVVGVAWLAAGGKDSDPIGILLSEIGLWAGLIGACALASRRKGTGHLLADFDARIAGWRDVAIGLGASVVGRFAAAIVVVVLVALGGQSFSGTNDTNLTQSHTVIGLVVSGLLLCVGAPIVEELFFRGLVQGSLTVRFGVGWGIWLQACLFGLVHVQPNLGRANITVILGIATFGLMQGWLRNRFGRLGPGIVAHSLFNLVAFIAIVVSGMAQLPLHML